MTRRSDIDAALQAIYNQVPSIPDCQRKCWVSCGPVQMADRERQRIRHSGYKISVARDALASINKFWCEALTREGKCAVYSVRPLTCRLWGVTESMPCPYGCQPNPGYLTDEQGLRLVMESLAIGGSSDAGFLIRPGDVDVVMAAFSASGAKNAYLKDQARGRRNVVAWVAAYDGELPPEITIRRRRKERDHD